MTCKHCNKFTPLEHIERWTHWGQCQWCKKVFDDYKHDKVYDTLPGENLSWQFLADEADPTDDIGWI